MAVVLDDLPPLMWHAELGKGLLGRLDRHAPPRRTAARPAGRGRAVVGRYEQRAWLRQLDLTVDAAMEDALLTTIARMDGTPFPATAALAGRWLRGRRRRPRVGRDDVLRGGRRGDVPGDGAARRGRGRPTTTTRAASGPATSSSCWRARGSATRSGSSSEPPPPSRRERTSRPGRVGANARFDPAESARTHVSARPSRRERTSRPGRVGANAGLGAPNVGTPLGLTR